MGISEGKFSVNTKWSKGDSIKGDGDVGQLSVDKNSISFHIDGSGDVFARNFVGSGDMHYYKVFTYGQGKSDSIGYFYRVSKVFLYNGSDYTDYTGEYIEGIKSFSFEIPELSDWLMIPSVEVGALEDGTAIIHELLTPTIILREANPKIYLKYEIKDLINGINDRNEMSLKKMPRVYVEFSEPTNDIAISSNIEIIMRFFALLIGRISTADDIRLTLHKKDMRMWLYLNYDFSVNTNINAYWMRYRTKGEDIHGILKSWFNKWYSFSLDQSFKFLQDAYFHTCSKRMLSIEDTFLTYCRFLEGYDLRVSKDEEVANQLYDLLIGSMGEKAVSDMLIPAFKEVGSKYRYKNVAKWISTGFLGRRSLESRIKRLDEKFYGIIAANSESIVKIDSPKIYYSKIVKTRNYYSHFKPNSTDILTIHELYYSLPVLDSIITTILMSEMGINSDTIKSIIIHDEVFWHLVTHLRPE
jgi:hypothetical protein